MKQEVRVSILGLVATISEIAYLLLPSRNVTEIPLKRRKSSLQPTNQPKIVYLSNRPILLYSTKTETSF